MFTATSPSLRHIARIVTFVLLGSIITPGAYAAGPITIADVPLQTTNTSKPNIVYSVDDSTSMGANFLPDYNTIADNSPSFNNNNYCRDHATNVPTGAFAVVNSGRCGTQGSAGAFAVSSFLPPVMAAGFNYLYYNPTILYIPPVKDGVNHFPSMDRATTANWRHVYNNNWWLYAYNALPSAAAAANRTKLSAESFGAPTATPYFITVSRWCNSEWPAGMLNPFNTSDPAWFDTSQCRINGVAYAASGGAPAVPMDYNYPFRDNAAGAPNGASFYIRNDSSGGFGVKMYCDASKMDTAVASCTPIAVFDPVSGCAAGTCPNKTTPCTGGYNYTPAGCNTNPLYGAPYGPCIGSECLPCNRNCISTSDVWTCPVPTYPKINWCNPNSGTAVQKAAAARYLLEANNPADGNTCRHANMNYTTGTNGGAPNTRSQFWPAGVAPYTTQVRCTVPDVGLPLHYYKTTTLWCNVQIPTGTVADKWKGNGTTGGLGCQPVRDATHRFPKFVQQYAEYTGNTDNYNAATPAFERCDLWARDTVGTSSATCLSHQYYDIVNSVVAPLPVTYWDPATSSIVDAGTTTRTFDQEMTNYANWFAYYRTRILATKTVSSLSFKTLNDKYRIGYHTMSNSAGSFLNIGDFVTGAGLQKENWFTRLHNTAVTATPTKATPTLDTVTRVGEYYKNGTHASLVGSTDPITLSCQRNYHIVMTDGATNQPGLAAPAAGNLDNQRTIAQGNLPRIDPFNADPVYVYGQCFDSDPSCGTVFPKAWPRPMLENAAVSNTLSDIALNYWVTDLRSGTVGPQNLLNHVGGWTGDPAVWQHLNFSALSLGAEGSLPGEDQQATIAAIQASTLNWPAATPANKPVPPPTAIDDLWHATINGFGKFVNAQNPLDLQFGLGQILSDVGNQPGARAGVAFTSVNLALPNAQYGYRVKFDPHWGGRVIKFQIDPITGVHVADNLWDASLELTTQLAVTGTHPTPWFDNRIVVTSADSVGNSPVAFKWANLTATQQATLGANAQIQQNVVEYLRGNNVKEGTKRGNYRFRGSPANFLGDIVHASPVVVGPTRDPNVIAQVLNEGTNAGYNAFLLANTSRPTRIYAAANDGMLHAFRDSDEIIGGVTYRGGSEHWAYIPSQLFRAGQAGLGGLVYQEGGNPAYQHRFMVDATPRVSDVKFGSDGSWHSILVGGLGKGGKAFYALDVTSPQSINPDPAIGEAQLANISKVLWEFNGKVGQEANMGYSYGKPLIAKIRNGNQWVVVVSSGYNNMAPDSPGGDGKGRLYFLNPETGALLGELITPIAVNGLTHIAGFVRDYHEQYLDAIYAGDLDGNVWRFDVAAGAPGSWTTAANVTLFAKLTDGVNPQPVTSAPQIEVDFNNSVDRWVFIGTGKLLDDPDLAVTTTQSMYALRDGTVNKMKTAGLPITRGQLVEALDIDGIASGTVAVNGWYDDLPAGQRIVSDVVAELNIVAYVAVEPGSDPCLTGQPAHVFARYYNNGYSGLEDTGGVRQESWKDDGGGVAISILGLNTNRGGTINDPILPPTLRGAITHASDGKAVFFDINPPPVSGRARMSWRILGE